MKEFEKHEVIFSEAIGVCRVTDIVNLSTNKQPPVKYYVLMPMGEDSKPSYIPVYDHQVLLRPLITVDEAKEKESSDVINIHEKQEIAYVLNHES